MLIPQYNLKFKRYQSPAALLFSYFLVNNFLTLSFWSFLCPKSETIIYLFLDVLLLRDQILNVQVSDSEKQANYPLLLLPDETPSAPVFRVWILYLKIASCFCGNAFFGKGGLMAWYRTEIISFEIKAFWK